MAIELGAGQAGAGIGTQVDAYSHGTTRIIPGRASACLVLYAGGIWKMTKLSWSITKKWCDYPRCTQSFHCDIPLRSDLLGRMLP